MVKTAAMFLGAGVAEIGGGWLIWQWWREGRPGWWAALGVLLLGAYGFTAALQPQPFGRVYAAYGGVFVALSLVWACAVDRYRPDLGDVIGAVVVLTGAGIMIAWPRPAA